MIGEEYRTEIEKPAPRKRVQPLQQIAALLVSITLIWFLFRPGADEPTGPLPDSAPAPRVASTSPAITDSLVELGLAAHVVGRSPYCRSVDRSIPVVGDLRDFDSERLALVRPSALFVQPPLAGTDPALRAFCERKSITLVERRLDSFDDLSGLADDIERVFGESVRGRLAPFRDALAAQASAAADAPRVLVVVSADPFLAAGTGNYIDALLRRAGFRNAAEATGWAELSVEQIVAARPDAIVGIAEREASAHEIESLLAILPWKDGVSPPVRVAAMPEVLSPSLAALARRDAFAALVREAAGAAR